MTFLTVVALFGLNAYAKQLVHGLVTTGMTDQVSWGLYIANFTFLVGMAAAAVMLVIPVYVYRNKELCTTWSSSASCWPWRRSSCACCSSTSIWDASTASCTCFWRFNFPISMLTWDVIVLNGYLLLNLHICGYLIYCAYMHRKPSKAVLHSVRVPRDRVGDQHPHRHRLSLRRARRPTVLELRDHCAALFSVSVCSRPSLPDPHPDRSRSLHAYHVPEKAFLTLRNIVTVALTINMFLLGCEVFTEFYTDSAHSASIHAISSWDSTATTPWCPGSGRRSE